MRWKTTGKILNFLHNVWQKKKSKFHRISAVKWGLIEKLEFVLNNDFERITYTEAIEILIESITLQEEEISIRVSMGN